jgi:hypothetical protein
MLNFSLISKDLSPSPKVIEYQQDSLFLFHSRVIFTIAGHEFLVKSVATKITSRGQNREKPLLYREQHCKELNLTIKRSTTKPLERHSLGKNVRNGKAKIFRS